MPSPYPFSFQTTIRYSLAQASPVTLKVYDVMGREVTTILQANQKPGVYTRNWNGKDRKDGRVSGGAYFIKFHTTDYTATSKLLLTR